MIKTKPIAYIMCGIPASGKSTWLKEHMKIPVVSRDVIRFSIINENDDYFGKEDQVFSEFVKQIQSHLIAKRNVAIDATHISYGSRNKLTRAIGNIDYDIHYIVLPITLKKALERNEKRTGLTRVPDDAMRSMVRGFSYPSYSENPRIRKIMEVDKNGNLCDVGFTF